MLTNFTWWQFFLSFLLFSALYYPIIIGLYFRSEVRRRWNGFFFQYSDAPVNDPFTTIEEQPQSSETTGHPLPSETELNTMMANLKEDIHNGMKAVKASHASRDQMLALLKNILAKYPLLKKAVQRVQLNEFILQECVTAGYPLQMAQVYALWATATDTQS